MDEATQEEKDTNEKTAEPQFHEKDPKLRQEELLRSQEKFDKVKGLMKFEIENCEKLNSVLD